jgi:glycopeptide antibiotics resistance protein
VLVPPWTDFSPNLSGLRDVLINILGFAPFGFCVLLYCQLAARERPILNAVLTVCAGAAVSLLIELIQVWLPIRVSSATDLVCNILGTLLGVLLARIVMRNDGGVRSRSAIK